ncbi:MAG: hypothetical protein M0Q96_00590 [Candidatus Omnitrophica bacterium]|jgi:hypothetical protein|nr:hypothetical protein [Candidatus Omnitrophota bacterium]
MLVRLRLFLLLVISFLVYTSVLAQDPNPAPEVTSLKTQLSGDTAALGCQACEALKKDYYKDNRYNEFFDFLNTYKNDDRNLNVCLDYYKALTRFDQLKYLEEKQSWDEYFAQGNTYRDQITESAKNAVTGSACGEAIQLKGLLLLWQFHHNQQDAFSETSLEELSKALKDCGSAVKDTQTIRQIADQLTADGEKINAKVAYKIYVDKIVTPESKDADLKNTARSFYQDGNLSLAENIYDIYIARITQSLDKENLVKELLEIASSFAYKAGGVNDLLYAEKVFQAAEQLGVKDAFNQELIYLRGFNLEKAKEYRAAGVFYSQLAQQFPKFSRNQEVIYKLGLINMYVTGDAAAAKSNFDQLISSDILSSYFISAFYQEGLLLQWQGDNLKAKETYSLLLNKAGDKFPETVNLAKLRLKEIDESKPLDYNLKTSLDLCFGKQDNGSLGISKVELSSSDYILSKGKKVTLSSDSYLPQSGCLQVELQYLWSGNTGSAQPTANEGSFQASYTDSGTKEVNLVVVSPTGIIGRSFDILDVN